MARRSKEELLSEFHRLCDILDVCIEFMKDMAALHGIPDHTDALQPRDYWLAQVGKNGTTLTDLISGTQQAINDQSEELGYWLEDEPAIAAKFLSVYKQRTGRDYFVDAGNPKKLARKLLKRNEIQSESEYYLLTGILSDVEQTVFDHKDIEKINQMLVKFENQMAAD